MSPGAVAELNSRLAAYQQQTGHQLLVWIGRSSGDVPIEDFAVRAFEAWKVGRQGIDDGLVLFIMADDRRLRIEVGYGLEGDVPDATASTIINDVIVPGIRAGNPDGAVTQGIEAVATAIGQPLPGGSAVPRNVPGQARPLGIGQLIVFGIVGIVFLFILWTNPALAIYLLASVLSGGGRHGGRGGGGFGGGGFRGGGGRSGGGGASGSW